MSAKALPLTDAPVLGHGGEQIVNRQGESEAGGAATGDALHRRDVIYRAGHWHMWCSCGFVSVGLLTKPGAQLAPCEIEELQILSRERKRRLHGSAA